MAELLKIVLQKK